MAKGVGRHHKGKVRMEMNLSLMETQSDSQSVGRFFFLRQRLYQESPELAKAPQ